MPIYSLNTFFFQIVVLFFNIVPCNYNWLNIFIPSYL